MGDKNGSGNRKRYGWDGGGVKLGWNSSSRRPLLEGSNHEELSYPEAHISDGKYP
jgi:hypothetical protein